MEAKWGRFEWSILTILLAVAALWWGFLFVTAEVLVSWAVTP